MGGLIEQLWPLFLVRDMSVSLTFYRDTLGFEVVGSAESDGAVFWCRLERGGACIMLQQAGAGTEITHSHDTFYFVCDDADAIYKELQDKEVELEPPSVAYYGMRQLFVPDPDGRGIIFESRTEEWSG